MSSLELKDLGPAERFLGVGVTYNAEDEYTLYQAPTVLELLSKYKFFDEANSVRAPIGAEDSGSDDECAELPADDQDLQNTRQLNSSSLWWGVCFGLRGARDQTSRTRCTAQPVAPMRLLWLTLNLRREFCAIWEEQFCSNCV